MIVIGEISLTLGAYRFFIGAVEDYRKAARARERYKEYDDLVDEITTVLQIECDISIS